MGGGLMGKASRIRAQRAAALRREAAFHEEFWEKVERFVTAMNSPEAEPLLEATERDYWTRARIDQADAAAQESRADFSRAVSLGVFQPATDDNTIHWERPNQFQVAALLLTLAGLDQCDHWERAPWRTPGVAILALRDLRCTTWCSPHPDALALPDNGRCDLCSAAPPRGRDHPDGEFYRLRMSAFGVLVVGDTCEPCALRMGLA